MYTSGQQNDHEQVRISISTLPPRPPSSGRRLQLGATPLPASCRYCARYCWRTCRITCCRWASAPAPACWSRSLGRWVSRKKYQRRDIASTTRTDRTASSILSSFMVSGVRVGLLLLRGGGEGRVVGVLTDKRILDLVAITLVLSLFRNSNCFSLII